MGVGSEATPLPPPPPVLLTLKYNKCYAFDNGAFLRLFFPPLPPHLEEAK